MIVLLLDESLNVDVFYEATDTTFDDNICLSFHENCPSDEKVFYGEETNLYITSEQARKLAMALLEAADQSDRSSQDDTGELAEE